MRQSYPVGDWTNPKDSTICSCQRPTGRCFFAHGYSLEFCNLLIPFICAKEIPNLVLCKSAHLLISSIGIFGFFRLGFLLMLSINLMFFFYTFIKGKTSFSNISSGSQRTLILLSISSFRLSIHFRAEKR